MHWAHLAVGFCRRGLALARRLEGCLRFAVPHAVPTVVRFTVTALCCRSKAGALFLSVTGSGHFDRYAMLSGQMPCSEGFVV